MKNQKFLNLFNSFKPIIGMIHLNGDSMRDVLERAKREIDIYIESEVDGIIVENYFGDINSVVSVLDYININDIPIIYGINILGDYKKAFELAKVYNAKFIQIDSVAGHLNQYNDMIYGEDLMKNRESSDTIVIGGVRFKYQPVLSSKSLEEDLGIGMSRSDGIVVTGTGTGIETDLLKIKEFKKIIENRRPLIIGAGINLSNVTEQLSFADAAIIGSYFKENHVDSGDLLKANVDKIMKKVKTLRSND